MISLVAINAFYHEAVNKRILLAFSALLIATASFALGKDSLNAVTMVSYEQGYLDDRGTLALKNNTSEEINDVTFQITYLNMAGKPLNYEVYTRKVSIAPGMTRQVDIPAYERGRDFSYYKSEADYLRPHRFKIKFELKGYNQQHVAVQTLKSAVGKPNVTGQSNIIAKILNYGHGQIVGVALLLFVIGFCSGLYVLVAVMAANRGRSAAAWIVFSLFFTPVIAIFLLLLAGRAYVVRDEYDDYGEFGRRGYGAGRRNRDGFANDADNPMDFEMDDHH